MINVCNNTRFRNVNQNMARIEELGISERTITVKLFVQSPLCLTPHEIEKISVIDKI